MISTFIQNHKIILITSLIIILFGSIIITFIIFLVFRSEEAPGNQITRPTTTPIPLIITEPISPLQKSIVGRTTNEEIARRSDIIETNILTDGEIQYLLTSPLIPRPNSIITDGNIVIFENAILPDSSLEGGFETITSINMVHGEPELTLTGSRFYGWHIEHRIYGTKGFTIVGNPNTDEIYEIHTYLPMDPDEYISTYGQDIDTELSPHMEIY